MARDPPRKRERSRSPSPTASESLLAVLGTRPTFLYSSVINVSDGSASPHEALDRATKGCPSVFLTTDAAKRSRAKRARRTEVLPCSNETFSRDDAALTLSLIHI